jgi:hypothetical protein
LIGTKWVFRNKLNEDGEGTRNKARLVCSDDDRLSQKFAKYMQNEFEMSLLGELSLFLGFQIR